MIIVKQCNNKSNESSLLSCLVIAFLYKMRFFVSIGILLLILSPLYAENINNDFDLSIKLNKDTNILLVTIAPKRDKKIKGMSEEKPFIILSGSEINVENHGILIQTEYILDSKPEVLQFPFKPVAENQDVTRLEIHLEMTYVPCIISSGVCKFPETIIRDYTIKASGTGISPGILNTGILFGFFILAVIGLVFYMKYKKDIIFTGFLLLIFSGVLCYSFIPADTAEISQAEYSRDIARTLCLSCVGIESAKEVIPVKRLATEFYTKLKEPVLITVFSAPWCGSCPAAKAYVKELSSLFANTLSFEVVDISLPAGKDKYSQYQTIFSFREPLPLPATIVSVNTSDVFYGTTDLEENIIQLIKKGLHESD